MSLRRDEAVCCSLPKGSRSELEKKIKVAGKKAASSYDDKYFVPDEGKFSIKQINPIPFAGMPAEEGERTYFLVDKETGDPLAIGSFIIRGADKKKASIERFGVHEGHRLKGYGSRMMEYLINLLRTEGVKTVETTAATGSKDFYLKSGFKPGPTGSWYLNL